MRWWKLVQLGHAWMVVDDEPIIEISFVDRSVPATWREEGLAFDDDGNVIGAWIRAGNEHEALACTRELYRQHMLATSEWQAEWIDLGGEG